jgi:subtilisin family serine protease
MVDYASLDYKQGEVLVKANFGVDLTKTLAQEGSEILYQWPELGWVVATVPTGETEISLIQKLKAYPEVLLVEPNMLYTLPEPPLDMDVRDTDVRQLQSGEEKEHEIDLFRQWGLRDINAEAAWAITTGSPDVIVAIVDTGVQVNHPEFADKEFVDPFDACVYDPTNPEEDDHGHGTHVAGIAADDGRGGKIAGVAWDSPIMPIRVMDNAGSIYTQYLVEAMVYLGDYAEANPSKRIVANMSIGGRGYSFAFKDAIDYAAEQGVLLVTSAGNDYKRVLSYPSAYNGVVSVAASTPHGVKSDFSTTGWWNSVAAPGVRIYSTVNNSDYVEMQGTSMASPFVTGAVALLLSEYRDLTPTQIKNQLEQTARGNRFSEDLGYGIIDVEAMLGELSPMAYGGLRVETDLGQMDLGTGVITIYNRAGELIAYGSTGEDGAHIFSALLPGEYTVALTYYDISEEKYVVKSQQATVTRGQPDTPVKFE